MTDKERIALLKSTITYLARNHHAQCHAHYRARTWTRCPAPSCRRAAGALGIHWDVDTVAMEAALEYWNTQ